MMMNENILKTLRNKDEYYPHNLEKKFPQILDKIMMLWDSPEFDSNLNKLMLDKREHHRQGFPPEVASEILRLSILHTQIHGSVASNSWVDASDVKIE
jgi:uncharacterized protein